MDKLQAYQTRNGGFAAVNETGATHGAQVLGTADTAESFTPPTGANVVRMCATADIWYDVAGNTAAKPSADDAADASVYLPAGAERWVQIESGPNISLVSEVSGTIVSLSFWK